MSEAALSLQEAIVSTIPRPSSVHIEIGTMEEEMARCQPTEWDFARVWEKVEAFSRAIEYNPLNAIAYRDRAVVLAFLGRDQESRRDRKQAVNLGLDRDLVDGDVSLMQKIAIGRSGKPAHLDLESCRSGWWSTFFNFLTR